MRSLRRWLPALGSLASVALLVVAAACGDGGAPQSAAPLTDPLAGEQPVEMLAISMRDIAFDTDELVVTAGVVVEITIMNAGTLLHDFTIDELPGDVSAAGQQRRSRFDVHVRLDGGESARLLLRVTAPGEYTFYCAVPGHRQSGMEGTLIVR